MSFGFILIQDSGGSSGGGGGTVAIGGNIEVSVGRRAGVVAAATSTHNTSAAKGIKVNASGSASAVQTNRSIKVNVR